MTQATKTQKQVQVIARYQIKRNGHVVYTVRSSNGQDTYTTTLVNGKATGCSCPSYKPCYHMVQLEAREAERNESKQQVSTPAATTDETHHVSRVDGLRTRWYPEYRQGAEWFRYPQPDGNQAVSFVMEGRAEAWLAERLAAVAEQAAEAKMDAFLKSMDEQYASDPRRGLSQGEVEAARSNMVHLYDEY